MKIIHYCLGNASGLNRVATNMVEAERKLGMQSFLSYTEQPSTKVEGLVLPEKETLDFDVGICHSHLPPSFRGKTVFIPHGTPEHCFHTTFEQHKAQGYTAPDPFMLSVHKLNNSDVTVTFWPRHEYIWKSLNPKADVRCIPMGVDKDFWSVPSSTARWTGNPSLFTCENNHQIKWPLDFLLAFPLIMEATGAVLHLHYVPADQHRFWYPLMMMNGSMFKSYSSAMYMDSQELRKSFQSADYYLSLVRYGDANCTCIEAKAAGCKVISYRGNPYADFWITEGDQRVMANELIEIFKGNVLPRTTIPVTDNMEVARMMKEIYESL